MQTTPEETGLVLSVISDNISASTTLASLCIALSSLIGPWVSSSTSRALMAGVVYGDASEETATVKFISLLVSFLASFTCFIQSARHYVHASFLMSTLGSDVPVSYVQRAVIRGGNFWAAGLRALYFATTLLMWVFGPVPMLACSVLTVAVLHLLDTNSVPLHHHRFTARNKGVVLQPGAAATSIVARGARASTANPALSSAVFSPVSYLS